MTIVAKTRLHANRSRRGGSQVAEFAPALFILFMMVLFPLVDLMYLGMAYCGGWYLNHMTSRACSTAVQSDWTTVANQQRDAWLASPIAAFSGSTVPKNDPKAGAYAGTGDQFVEVETHVAVKPFMALDGIPFLAALNIDGLTKPAVFRYVDKRPREETAAN
ncbi:MAG: hypothetical protein J0H83_02365 [Candidatus Melainabacteria bacterium]|jgi:hypothetical protein|nr:hypothetical protein [Candidatus Melainabacteria bacterium]MBX9672332.1 hypothetical protein [Candidatus Obscuribacterales bacterium]